MKALLVQQGKGSHSQAIQEVRKAKADNIFGKG